MSVKDGIHSYLLHTDQGHWLPRRRVLDGHGGHGFDEDHPSVLQSQRARQSVALFRGLRSREGVHRVGVGDQTQVLQGEVQNGGTRAEESVGLLGGVRRGGRFVQTRIGGGPLLEGGGWSGACGEKHVRGNQTHSGTDIQGTPAESVTSVVHTVFLRTQ